MEEKGSPWSGEDQGVVREVRFVEHAMRYLAAFGDWVSGCPCAVSHSLVGSAIFIVWCKNPQKVLAAGERREGSMEARSCSERPITLPSIRGTSMTSGSGMAKKKPRLNTALSLRLDGVWAEGDVIPWTEIVVARALEWSLSLIHI